MVRYEQRSGRRHVEQLFSQARPRSAIGHILQFPMVRFLQVLVGLGAAFAFSELAVDYGVEKLSEPYAGFLDGLRPALIFVLLLASYRLYCRIIEKRQAFELGAHNCFSEAALGVILGAGLTAAAVTVLVLKGSYRFDSAISPMLLLKTLIPLGFGVFFEELVFRVTLFRLAEELAGSWIALFSAAAAFGLFHTLVQGPALETSVTLFLAGLLLTAAFMWTRRIWLAWGVHFGWKFTQAVVFGLSSTDLQSGGRPALKITGSGWLTGDTVGVGASLVVMAVTLLSALLILLLAVRGNHVIGPSWKR